MSTTCDEVTACEWTGIPSMVYFCLVPSFPEAPRMCHKFPLSFVLFLLTTWVLFWFWVLLHCVLSDCVQVFWVDSTLNPWLACLYIACCVYIARVSLRSLGDCIVLQYVLLVTLFSLHVMEYPYLMLLVVWAMLWIMWNNNYFALNKLHAEFTHLFPSNHIFQKTKHIERSDRK